MSEAIPRAVLTEALQEKINRRRVLAAVFCTFRFEPAFFDQEIVPVLFDLSLHQDAQIRLLQLEEALRPLSGKISVYYDPRALVEGDQGSASLDIRRIPVRPRTGYFHPKNAFVLVEDPETGERTLLVLTASANLTRAGWWENVECVHLEELAEGSRTRLRDGLVEFLDHLRYLSRHVREHGPLDEIRGFVRGLQPIMHRSAGGVLHPHFFANGRRDAWSLVDFLDDTVGADLRGANMEIISPYLDDADESGPIVELVQRFQPKKWRVLLPEDRGFARCREPLYDWVRELGGEWGRLPGQLTSAGDRGAKQRTVHAKTYRFFTAEREIVFVGSFNLTRAAHQEAGNVESGVLVEGPRGGRRRRFWLDAVEERPTFDPGSGEEEGADLGLVPLLVRYDWASERADVLWDGKGRSPHLKVLAHGLPVFEVDNLEPAVWTPLSAEDAQALAGRLRSTRLLTVHDGDQRGIILVLEIGMAHRPSLLLDLTPAQILKYWSLLTAEQRAAVIAEHGERLTGTGAEQLRIPKDDRPIDSIFDRFAGMFHGFASLARSVTDSLEAGKVEEARFRMLGAKYDSLPVLVERVARDDDGDLLDRYLMVLCAKQVVDRIRRGWPDFCTDETPGVGRLKTALAVRAGLREQVVARNDDPDMERFLDWFESRFLREAAEVTA